MRQALLAAAIALCGAEVVVADPVEVHGFEAHKTGMGWRISVTLVHPDTGWDHYADAWRVETADGTVLGVRELLHPHVDEQPFTRSLSSVMLPDGTSDVHVRAHCTVHGWTEEARVFPLTRGN